MFFLLHVLLILFAAFVIIKVAVKILRKTDVESKVEKRKNEEEIYKKYSDELSSQGKLKAKTIKDKINKFNSNDY